MASIAEVGAGWSSGSGWMTDPVAPGASHRPSPAVARRRRFVLAGAVAVTVVACLTLSGGLAGGSSSPSPSPGAALSVSLDSRVYTVQPGDTLWGIAVSLAGNGDPRPIMQRLAKQVPGGVLVVGQRLILP